MSDVIMYCANCVYWDLYEKDGEEIDCCSKAECHRYPPNVPCIGNVSGDEDTMLVDAWLCCINGTVLMDHPYTFACNWCGEFKPIDNPRLTEEPDWW